MKIKFIKILGFVFVLSLIVSIVNVESKIPTQTETVKHISNTQYIELYSKNNNVTIEEAKRIYEENFFKAKKEYESKHQGEFTHDMLQDVIITKKKRIVSTVGRKVNVVYGVSATIGYFDGKASYISVDEEGAFINSDSPRYTYKEGCTVAINQFHRIYFLSSGVMEIADDIYLENDYNKIDFSTSLKTTKLMIFRKVIKINQLLGEL